MGHILRICSPIDGCLLCLYLLVILNISAIDIQSEIIVNEFFLMSTYLEAEVPGIMVALSMAFSRSVKLCSKVDISFTFP